jgi:hypothetical protein
LLNDDLRLVFHRVYDRFVRLCILPFIDVHLKQPGYYYQLFPCVRVIRPGEFSIGPHCDISYGFLPHQLNFVIPLTDAGGASSLYMESNPGE